MIATAVMRFCVIVPVLSVHITVVLHKVSTALSFLISAFFLYIFWTPRASVIVTIAGNHSGIAETARLIAMNIISMSDDHLINPMINITIHIANAIPPRSIHNFFNFFCNGVCISCVDCTISAIAHNSVCIPVLTTIPFAFPVDVIVHAKTILCLSASIVFSGIVSVSLFTVLLSPVRIDSSMVRLIASISLISAFILSHASKSTISPGTNNAAGMIISSPSLITLAVGEVSLLSMAMDFSALYSWKKPNNAFNMIIAPIAMASEYSWSTILRITAPIKTITRGSLNWSQSIFIIENLFFSWSLFGPYIFSLFSAIFFDSHLSLSDSNALMTFFRS